MTTELLNGHFDAAASQLWARFLELVMAPVNEPSMVWFAAPLVIATLMMALYFGRYHKEELGWNSAFANTMVFLFVSIDLIRQMYESAVPYSWMNILNSPLYLSLTVGLAGFSIVSMIIIYYHLLPKTIAFKIFSDLPVNIAIYIIMTIIYAGVAADLNTLAAALILFIIAWTVVKTMQYLQRLAGKKRIEAEQEAEEELRKEQEEAEKKLGKEPAKTAPEMKKKAPLPPGEKEGGKGRAKP